MLVITRRKGQSIQIGTEVTIEVVETRANSVRLGVYAPRQLKIRGLDLKPFEQIDISLPEHAKIVSEE